MTHRRQPLERGVSSSGDREDLNPATIQFKQQLAGMSYEEQQKAIAPSLPLMLPTPVQLKENPDAEPMVALREAAAGDPIAAQKVEDVAGEAAPKAQSKKTPFAKGALENLESKPTDGPLNAMRNEITDAGKKYLCLGPAVPGDQIVQKGGLSRLVGLKTIFNYYLKPSIEKKYEDAEDFIENGVRAGHFDPDSHLDNRKSLKGKAEETWWFPGSLGTRVDLDGLRKLLTIEGDSDYAAGAVRLNITAEEMDQAKIEVHKSTAFDGVLQGWGEDPWWVPSDDPHWGVTKGGSPEAVMKSTRLRHFNERKLIMEEDPAPSGEEENVSPETGPDETLENVETPDGALATQEDGDAVQTLPDEVALSSGIVLHELSGDAKWKKGSLVSFEGNCSASIPMGESNSLDVKFDNVDVNVKRGKVKNGTGTFTATKAIPLLNGEMIWKVAPGATGSVEVKNNIVKTLSGAMALLGGNADSDFIEITLNAFVELAKLDRFVVDGTGGFTMLDAVQIPGGWGQIEAKTKGTATITQNKLSRLEANPIGVTLALPFGEERVELSITGDGKYDHSAGLVEEANGSVELLTPIYLGGGVTVNKAEGHASVVENELVGLGGSLTASVADDEGDLLKGSISGEWTNEGNGISGSADLKLVRDLEWAIGKGISVVIHSGSGGSGEMVDGKPSTLTGGISADIYDNGQMLVSISAEGTIDLINGVLVKLSGHGALKKQISLLDGGLTVDEMEADIEIANGLLVGAGGSAKLTAPIINIDKAEIAFNWRNDGTQDLYSWSGDFDWELFKEKDTYLGGHIGVAYQEDGSFKAGAAVSYSMGEGFSASANLEIDNSLEPLIRELSIGVTVPLMDQTTVFDMSMNLVNIPLRFIVLVLNIGLDVGASLTLDPLTVKGAFSVFDWKPTKDSKVPYFEAELAAPWGMTFQAFVGAYIEGALDIFIASAGIGALAKLVFEVPIDIDPTLKLQGDGDGVGGSFGISLAINPKLFLELIPYLEAYVIFIDTWRYDMAEYEFELADLGSFEWSDSFTFGESKSKPSASKSKAKAGAPVEKHKSNQKTVGKKDSLREGPVAPEHSQSKDVVLPGGDTISGDELMGKKKDAAKGDEFEGKNRSEMTKYERMFDGIDAIDGFIKYLGDAMDALLEGGPVFGPILLAWRVIDGELSFQRLGDLFARMIDGIAAVGEFITDMGDNPWDFTSRLGKWLSGDITFTQLLMEDDDEVRKAVKKGVHRKPSMGPEAHGGMLRILCHPLNACTNADEKAVISICRVAGQRGHLNEALTYVKGSMYMGANQVLYKLDWDEDDEIRRVFKKYKINPDKIYTNAAKDRMRNTKYPKQLRNAVGALALPSWRIDAFDIFDKDGLEPALAYCKKFG